MDRKALIIGTPGVDLPGVAVDMANYQQFLLSPLGGAWYSNEIVMLKNPTKSDVVAEVNKLGDAEYSMVIFAGHGRHPKMDGSTIVQLRPGVEMDSNELKVGAKKHSLILDCCRKLEKVKLAEDVLAKAMKGQKELNSFKC